MVFDFKRFESPRSQDDGLTLLTYYGYLGVLLGARAIGCADTPCTTAYAQSAYGLWPHAYAPVGAYGCGFYVGLIEENSFEVCQKDLQSA